MELKELLTVMNNLLQQENSANVDNHRDTEFTEKGVELGFCKSTNWLTR